MSIREATLGDAKSVVRLVSALLLELGGKPLSEKKGETAFEVLVSDPKKGFVMISEADNRAVAVCTVSHVHAIRSLGQYSIIQEMYVEPHFRGAQVGSSLLRQTLRQSVFRGSGFVELGTPIQGQRQVDFYLRSGFFIVGERLRFKPPASFPY